MASANPAWVTAAGTLLTGLAAITAIGLVGVNEAWKLRSQHRHDERLKLESLIGRYHGPMLEAAVDWDRRMHQLYDSAPASRDHHGEESRD
jgi:hypothetical protein